MQPKILPAVLLVCLVIFPLALIPIQCRAGSPGHQITCSSARVARAYQKGLENEYLGHLDIAMKDFQDASRQDPECAMAEWGLSRTFYKAGRVPDALAALAKASELAPNVDDREQKMITAWGRWLKSVGQPEEAKQKAMQQVRSDLDLAIALYPDDPELWLLRGEAAESPLRAGPFYIAALRLDPSHPFGKVWSPKAPPPPDLIPQPTQPVKPAKEAPKLFEGLGKLSHPITTSNPLAQQYYEQGLRCFHAYVMLSDLPNTAFYDFQYAATLDPECAMAYWGLSFVLRDEDGIKPIEAANRALELALKRGTDKERRFCAARVLELSGDSKRGAFLDALDGAIAAYPDDVELWIWRGKVYTGYSMFGNVPLPSLPYQIAANRMHPEHPSPNHELIHGYEEINRPALAWPYTVGFRQSAPNLPHANHMQAHIAMRLGRWQEGVDCTRTARQKSLEGYPEFNEGHHIDIMIRVLSHSGRFKEAEAETNAARDSLTWARLLQLKVDIEGLNAWAEKHKSPDGTYIGVLAKLDQGDSSGALPLVNQIEEQWKKNPANFYRYSEVEGRYLVQTGKVEEGLKLLQEAAARAVNDYQQHAYGGGGYLLEVWGETALQGRRWDEAEQAFLEALAHEHGSVIGAMGMQVVCEQRGQKDLAAQYAARAAEIWKGADPGALDRQLSHLRKLAVA